MKPCSKNRKSIAWLALGALEPTEAAALREHLSLCERCRRYWNDISAVQRTLDRTAPASDIEATETFHQKLAARLEAASSVPQSENLRAWLTQSILNWRVAVPVSAAILALVLLSLTWKQPMTASKPPARAVVDLPPTIGNYQIVVSQSLEEFAELLTRQGDKPLPPAPIYTASGTVLPN